MKDTIIVRIIVSLMINLRGIFDISIQLIDEQNYISILMEANYDPIHLDT
jgi:hypothetical protein